MVFLTIVRSSSSVLRPHRIQCAASCDSLNVHVAEIGQRWLARFRCCLVKMALRGAQGWPDKTSLAFGRRSGTVALLQAFSDRKSTRLNSSHSQISYAVFCLKKKN